VTVRGIAGVWSPMVGAMMMAIRTDKPSLTRAGI